MLSNAKILALTWAGFNAQRLKPRSAVALISDLL